jgi:hypothetical protein
MQKALRALALVGMVAAVAIPSGAQGDIQLRQVVKLGDPIEGILVYRPGGLAVQALNDRGEALFIVENEAGGQLLVRMSGGKPTLLVAAGRDAPGGKWPRAVKVLAPAGMNSAGNVAFGAEITVDGKTSTGTFLSLAATAETRAVAVKGAPAANGRPFEQGGGAGPAITAGDEIAFTAQVKNDAGRAQEGVFLWSSTAGLTPIALPDQGLPGGKKLAAAFAPSPGAPGRIAFLGRRAGDSAESAFLWEQGTVAPLADAGTDVPGPGRITAARGVWLNPANGSALLLARFRAGDGLLRIAEGNLIPVAVPGQEMPGGGKLRTIQEGGVSSANAAGRHAFLAVLEDKTTAAYLLEPDGRLVPLIKENAATPLGKVPNVGQGEGTCRGIAMNDRGEVALILRVGSGQGSSGGGGGGGGGGGRGGGGGGGGGGDGQHGGGGGGGADALVILTLP